MNLILLSNLLASQVNGYNYHGCVIIYAAIVVVVPCGSSPLCIGS